MIAYNAFLFIGNHGDMARGNGGTFGMISYDSLWRTMKERGATTYTLTVFFAANYSWEKNIEQKFRNVIVDRKESP